MVKQILPKDIPKFKRGFTIFANFKSRDLYFEILDKNQDILKKFHSDLCEYLEYTQGNNHIPGIFSIDTIDNKVYFRITYVVNEITEEKVIEFAKSLGL
ncbi:MAG: hypothetical protein M1429_03580 [Patescibacteria group bacterium]|nr:hypothetical protein [Patescibacteria group bacterium]